jgi:hypothetical protein
MKLARRIFAVPATVFVLAAFGLVAAARSAPKSEGRIVLLMVWDGLRPDLVDQHETPNLFALAREGVLFEHHHSVFPSITMVNAAALSTGAPPGTAGIFGDSIYFMPVLGAKAVEAIPMLGERLEASLSIENSHTLAALNGSGGFDGYLLGVEGVAQQVERDGGYVAIIGRQGPTFLFDEQVASRPAKPANFLFVSDDMASPRLSGSELAGKPPIHVGDLDSVADRDHWFARLVVNRALPAARSASAHGHSALIVFWQHNPDFVQHVAGLGTQPALNALRRADADLARICAVIGKLGIAHRTDLMIVSDHGFATIRVEVSLADLLVTAGIKKSRFSDDIVIAQNGGEDLVYLSSSAFTSKEARRATLARIVDFAEAQEWCGPIFSREPAPDIAPANRPNYPGWIPGTFAQQALALYNPGRSPDLIISFRELPDVDNRGLTGPGNPAFALGLHGQVTSKNVSFRLVRPIDGVVYSDANSFSTGMGMHGAAGARELHSFAAALGPDFRRHFSDSAPTGNTDVAPTIRKILDLSTPAGAAGRVMQEALSRGRVKPDSAYEQTLTSYLVLQGQEVVTTLHLTQFEGHNYLDGASVSRNSPNGSP